MMVAETLRQASLRDLLSDLTDPAMLVDVSIHGLSLDSRKIQAGDLFIACAGLRHDGRHYINAAIQQGASAVVFDTEQARLDIVPKSVPVIPVADLKHRLGLIAARFYQHPSRKLHTIGVTGTNGKTSVTHFIAGALRRQDEPGPCGLIGTLGYGLPGALDTATHTTPDAIRVQQLLAGFVDTGVHSVALEVSSHALDQGRVAGVDFDIAVFTNLSRDHLDYHGGMAQYARIKRRLFRQPGLSAAVINIDDPEGQSICAEITARMPVFGISLQPGPARDDTLRATRVSQQAGGLVLEIQVQGRAHKLETQLLGEVNAWNLLAALGVLLHLGLPAEEALCGLTGVRGVAGRMEAFHSANPQRPLVVVDYAHTPDGLKQALRSLRPLCRGALWCVFGCGGERDSGKRPQMGAIAGVLAEHVVLTNDNPRSESPQCIIEDILAGIPGEVAPEIIGDRGAAITEAVRRAGPEDIVLIAGKGHEDYQLLGERRLPFSDRDFVARLLGEGS